MDLKHVGNIENWDIFVFVTQMAHSVYNLFYIELGTISHWFLSSAGNLIISLSFSKRNTRSRRSTETQSKVESKEGRPKQWWLCSGITPQIFF